MVQGNGATIDTIEEFCDIADEVCKTLCAHNIREIVAFMGKTEPRLFEAACQDPQVAGSMYNAMTYMAVRFPALFQLALAQTSVGCY